MKSLRLDKYPLHPLFAPVFLAAVILAVYCPTLNNGFHTIDDPGIVALYSSHPPLLDILLPGSSYYYRPIIGLSYYLDSRLWGMEPSVMHLENILLHMLNAILVFLISRRIAANYPERSLYIPLLVALLFALHPLNVEAISWIAGRTDPLAALFVLSACYYWQRWLDEPKWQHAVYSAFFFVLGVLTKETAVTFLPVSLLLVLVWPAVTKSRRRIAAGCIVVLSAVVVVVVLSFWKSGVISLGRFFEHNDFDVAGWLQNSLVAFGFYVKKLLVPLPLNFAITEVSPLYGVLGLLVLVLLAVALIVFSFDALFFAASALMILPALIAATKQICWTPFAERYMYMPNAFLCIGTSCLLLSIHKKHLNRLAPLLMVVSCIAGYVSFQRNLLWKDKLAFYQDAVAQSPGFGSVYNELGGVLMQQRQIAKAAEAFAIADRLNKRPSIRMLIKSNIMATMIASGHSVEARDYFFTLFGDKKAAPVDLLEQLYTADRGRLDSLKKNEKVLLANDLLETLDLIYQKNQDPFRLYQSGQMSLVTGNTCKAAEFFHRSHFAAPVDAHYKAAAKTYFMKLEAGK